MQKKGKLTNHFSMILLPRLYAILDRACWADFEALLAASQEIVEAGVRLLEYRDKSGDARTMLDQARRLKYLLSQTEPAPSSSPPALAPWRLIMNDRADLCLAADFDGVHVGQDDLSPKSARQIIGAQRWLGISTHNPDQVREADRSSADYIAIGPVFATASKLKPDPVVGLDGVRRARALTRKPLVAIGGITRQNCRSVIAAGADSVAVISDLIRDPGKSAEEFLRILG
jgi:thiamine-phosphate pyrophosphorylase